MQALTAPGLAGIIICPSNPWLSIDPILAVPGMREAMRASGAPVIAVTPIVGGKALKGPTAKIMAELGIAPDARSIASHYGDLIDGFVLDTQDAQSIDAMPRPVTVTNTVMHTLDDKVALARHCLAFCDRLAQERAIYRRTCGCGGALMSDAATWAIVPVKSLEQAKQRLAAVLPLAARRRLMLVMLEDVLATLRHVERLEPVLVVTPDAEVAELAANAGAKVLREASSQGHSAAAIAGFAYAQSHGAVRALTLPADAPFCDRRRAARPHRR